MSMVRIVGDSSYINEWEAQRLETNRQRMKELRARGTAKTAQMGRLVLDTSSGEGYVKVVVRADRQELWDAIEKEYAGSDPIRWKWLACLHLYSHCGWTLPMIGNAVGSGKSAVRKMIQTVIRDLKNIFDVEWDDPAGILNTGECDG